MKFMVCCIHTGIMIRLIAQDCQFQSKLKVYFFLLVACFTYHLSSHLDYNLIDTDAETFPLFNATLNALHRGVKVRLLTNNFGDKLCPNKINPLTFLHLAGHENVCKPMAPLPAN